jgi:hypothetical protein
MLEIDTSEREPHEYVEVALRPGLAACDRAEHAHVGSAVLGGARPSRC